MGKAIGIDLGTTNSVVAYKDTAVKVIQTGANNEDLCRSCVALDKSGQFLVGNAVYKNWKRYSPNIVVSVKRLMGTGFSDPRVQKMRADSNAYPYGIKKPSGGTEEAVAIVLRGKEYSPEQISGEILKALKTDANTKLGDVTHAVITVPAYFTEKQKTATKKAAELAGLHVQRLLAEPTAAAISYGFDQMMPGESKQVLVYDFGGGTFDLSILMAVDGQFIESGSGGDRWLGGDDIDRLLSDFVCKEVEKRDGFSLSELLEEKTEKEKSEFIGGLKSGIEEAKKSLSQVENATVYFSDFLENEDGDPVEDFVISRSTFDTLITPLIKRTIDLIDELLEKTGIPIETIDNILLVGGSSCIPLVRKMLSDKYGSDKVLSSEKPMLAIAEGAAILAQSLPSDEEAITATNIESAENQIGVVLTTKHQTFIQLENPDGSHRMEKIIDSQEVLPFEGNKKFRTVSNNQKIVEIKLFTDAENGSFIKTASGFFTISENLPAMSDLNFTFNLDEDETMTAKVKIVKTGKVAEIRLGRGQNDSSCLSELSQKIEDVLSNPQISDSKKATFIGEMQQIIDTINKNNYTPTDSRWGDFEEEIRVAHTRALMGDKQENNIGEIFATILLGEFSRFLSTEDETEMRELLFKIKNSNDNFEKDSIRQDLERIANKYSLLIHIFMFKLIGDNSSNPQVAGRAVCVYDEMVNALNNNNINEVNELIRSNGDLLEEIQSGSINIGMGTGLA
ncbi:MULTISPECIES: Hsp70 family protein [unclassified Bacteroides]|uniref:Hsp70 family protein n=1 Tax=unclassified Bacteroides TaxID=2646097 RepID=UPI001C3780B6|nr:MULTISPECIES: Hsp70 family protein [unclassified Bacteroides]MBV3657709.1 Hsp70 family protein [Bacteroides sp. MSK.18.91]MBV3670101.1 Hsp70 family protein [Bacteroides sp. MSK.18.83]MBV3713380.1 Hsp70 family protein [Bacteroides sp. MSK.18.39]MBV3741061.1 Hsp70 family protein [Bacteroides sp. MSK.18.37]MBV3757203.1 Hsp70 family protein [Bacteroides sp. MSK.18.22]